MATMVQVNPSFDGHQHHTYNQQDQHNLMQPPQQVTHHYTHHQHHSHKQNTQHGGQYVAAIPMLQENNEVYSNAPNQVFNTFKQINIIPGLDEENAIVDTGVKIIRQLASQVQISNSVNEFDGKRMRRSIQRRTVDYNASTIQMIKHRLFRRSAIQKAIIQPDPLYFTEIVQPKCILHNPINSVTTRFVRASTNKIRCPVFTVAWTPEGRRVVTGTSSGEFTLWNGLTFNFETILQAHESAVRAMEWSNNDMWLLSGDHNGVIKYWQSNMNNVKMIQAHNDPIRGVSFCPTDNKFVTCSDDGTIKQWDFYRCVDERTLKGHGAEVKCIDWHPSKSIIATGSKDSQQPLKLWDPKSGISLATIHNHKSTVMDLHWNRNGNWLLTGSRDRLVKVFDIRVMKEMYTFRGHKREAASVNWHPLYEEMFASGGSDGSILFWLMGAEKELGVMDNAHDGMIWDLKWHPLGHILCSASNDHTTKFWTRNRPGDKMRDKYNLNVLPTGFEDDYEYELPNISQSDVSSQLNDSLNSSTMAATTPSKAAALNQSIIRSDADIPAVKALLKQTSLEVSKPSIKETPAQIFTVTSSNLRPNAPTFRINRSIQQEALEDGEKLEKLRERQLRGRLNEDPNAVVAPSLLDLEIARPDFLQDIEWDNNSEEPPPFIEDLKRRTAERQQKKQEEMEKSRQWQQSNQMPPSVANQMPPPGHMPPPNQPPQMQPPGPMPAHSHNPPIGPPFNGTGNYQDGPMPPPGSGAGPIPDNRSPFQERRFDERYHDSEDFRNPPDRPHDEFMGPPTKKSFGDRFPHTEFDRRNEGGIGNFRPRNEFDRNAPPHHPPPNEPPRFEEQFNRRSDNNGPPQGPPFPDNVGGPPFQGRFEGNHPPQHRGLPNEVRPGMFEENHFDERRGPPAPQQSGRFDGNQRPQRDRFEDRPTPRDRFEEGPPHGRFSDNHPPPPPPQGRFNDNHPPHHRFNEGPPGRFDDDRSPPSSRFEENRHHGRFDDNFPPPNINHGRFDDKRPPPHHMARGDDSQQDLWHDDRPADRWKNDRNRNSLRT